MTTRRSLLKKSTAWLLGSGALALAARTGHAQPRYTVSAEQLQQAVATRFPLRYPVGGLLTLDVKAPTLRLLPAQNRLGAEMPLDASGPALGRSYPGSFDVDFALRYEASDQTIRAHQLRVNALRLSGLPPDVSLLLSAYGAALAEQTLLEVVVHTLRPQDLALADVMGLQPGRITVAAEGLVIDFVAKVAR